VKGLFFFIKNADRRITFHTRSHEKALLVDNLLKLKNIDYYGRLSAAEVKGGVTTTDGGKSTAKRVGL